MKNELVSYDIDNGIKNYFSELKNVKSLSKAEERILLEKYKINHDISARNKIILHNLKYACKLASEYRDRGLSFGDLISEANYGLIESIDKFDLSQDVKLISYSKWWIMQKMQSAIDKKNRMPEDEFPTDNEGFYNMDSENDVVYESPSAAQNELFSVDVEEDERKKNALEEAEYLMAILNDRESDMINMYYGRNGYDAHTLEEIGHKYSLTKERVRQIIEKSINKLKSKAMLEDSPYLSR